MCVSSGPPKAPSIKRVCAVCVLPLFYALRTQYGFNDYALSSLFGAFAYYGRVELWLQLANLAHSR